MIEWDAWSQFDVAHVLAGTRHQARGIVQVGAMEESDVDVCLKHIHITEGRIGHARDGTAVMDQLSNIFATLAHSREPPMCDGTSFGYLLRQPGVNGRIMFKASRQPKDSVHSEECPPTISSTAPTQAGNVRAT
jgi:hypothetical protein